MEGELLYGEKVEPLGLDARIIVSKEHTFGTDALLLADFAAVRPSDVLCDMGTGCGIIPFLWYKKGCRDVTGIDISEQAVSQFSRSIEMCSFGDGLKALCMDLKDAPSLLKKASFDLVSMNPPYKKAGSGIPSADSSGLIARHEYACDLDDIVSVSSSLLRFGGRFVLCNRPERLTDIACCMRSHALELKRIRFVKKLSGRQPWLVLCEGRRGGRPDLIVKNEDGSDSEEMTRIYGDYPLGRTKN